MQLTSFVGRQVYSFAGESKHGDFGILFIPAIGCLLFSVTIKKITITMTSNIMIAAKT